MLPTSCFTRLCLIHKARRTTESKSQPPLLTWSSLPVTCPVPQVTTTVTITTEQAYLIVDVVGDHVLADELTDGSAPMVPLGTCITLLNSHRSPIHSWPTLTRDVFPSRQLYRTAAASHSMTSYVAATPIGRARGEAGWPRFGNTTSCGLSCSPAAANGHLRGIYITPAGNNIVRRARDMQQTDVTSTELFSAPAWFTTSGFAEILTIKIWCRVSLPETCFS